MSDVLSCGQAHDWHTHTTTRTYRPTDSADDNPQNWHRVKTRLERINFFYERIRFPMILINQIYLIIWNLRPILWIAVTWEYMQTMRKGVFYLSVHMVSKVSARTSSNDIPTTTSFLSNGVVALLRLCPTCWCDMFMVTELATQLIGIVMSLYIPKRHIWQGDRLCSQITASQCCYFFICVFL